MQNGFTDLHQHLLWGMDDGARSFEETQAMLRQSVRNGVSVIAATVHANPIIQPFDFRLYNERLRQINAWCASSELPIRIVKGCEVFYSSSVPDLLRDGKLPTLGQTRYALLEFAEDVSVVTIDSAANKLSKAGYYAILSHVERYRCLRFSPKTAVRLRESCSLLYQMDCAPILKTQGWLECRFVKKMLDAEAIDFVASDAHDAVHRPVNIRQAHLVLTERYGKAYADSLCKFGWRIL